VPGSYSTPLSPTQRSQLVWGAQEPPASQLHAQIPVPHENPRLLQVVQHFDEQSAHVTEPLGHAPPYRVIVNPHAVPDGQPS
jgi:hypothetical protein